MESIEEKAHEWFTRGVAALNSHPPDLGDAVRCFSRSSFLCPSAPAPLAHRAECFLRLADFRSALVDLRRAHGLDPADRHIRARLAQMHYLSARLALERGEANEAVRALSAALGLQPTNADFWLWRIKAWVRGKAYGRALAELNAFLTQTKPSDTTGDAGQQQQPHHAAASTALSGSNIPAPMHAHFDEKMSDGSNLSSAPAGALLVAAQSEGGGLLSRSQARTVQALLLRAKLHILLGRDELALRDAGWAHTLAPEHAEVRSLLTSLSARAEELYSSAVAHELAGQRGAALDALTRALELNPQQLQFYALRARLLREERRYDDALADLKIALGLAHTMRLARLRHERAQRAQQAAAEAAARGEDLSPPSASQTDATFVTAAAAGEDELDEDAPKDELQRELERSLALTFNGLGVQYFESGEFPHGVSCLSKAIELDSSVASFFANRGDCFHSMGDRHSALEDYAHARKLDPKHPAIGAKMARIHITQARELFNRADYESAESEVTRALVAEPHSSAAHFLRARVRQSLGRWEECYRDATRALDLNPADSQARALVLQLRQVLLRPADLARAPPLPPVPTPDQPFRPAAVAMMAANAAASATKAAGSPLAAARAQRAASVLPSTGADAILRMVYGGNDRASPVAVRGQKGSKAGMRR